MGIRKRVAREARDAVDEAYSDDLGKANAAGGIVSGLFRKIGTGEIDESDINKAATEAEQKLQTEYPEAWNGGVKEAFRKFFG